MLKFPTGRTILYTSNDGIDRNMFKENDEFLCNHIVEVEKKGFLLVSAGFRIGFDGPYLPENGDTYYVFDFCFRNSPHGKIIQQCFKSPELMRETGMWVQIDSEKSSTIRTAKLDCWWEKGSFNGRDSLKLLWPDLENACQCFRSDIFRHYNLDAPTF